MDKINAKDVAQFVGVGISVLGMLITAVTFAAWVGALATDVKMLKEHSVKAERIATLESEVRGLVKSNDELKVSINNLINVLQPRRRRSDDADNQGD